MEPERRAGTVRAPEGPAGEAHSSIDQLVDWRLLQQVYRNEVRGGVLSLIAAGVLAAVTGVYSSMIWLPALWWLAIASSVVARFVSSRRFVSVAAAGASGLWRRRYAVGTAVTGLAWGAGAAAMLLAAPVPRSQTAILVVVVAVTTAAVVHQGAFLRGYLGYLLGAQLPIVGTLAFGPAPGNQYIAWLILMYCIAMSALSKWYHQDLRAATRLEIEKQRLSDELAAANRDLETDIDARLRAEALLSTERNLLENVARQMSLSTILDELNLDLEALFPGSKCSIVLLDGHHGCVEHMSAPSVPPSSIKGVDGAETGLHAASCGTAMRLKQRVIVEDICSDPSWRALRDPALESGLRACWSAPIVSRSNDVLGAFAIYRSVPHSPAREELESVNRLGRLIALVIEDIRSSERLQLSEQRFRDFASAAADWFWEMDPELRCTYVSEKNPSPGYPGMALIMKRTRQELAKTGLAGPKQAAAAAPSPSIRDTPIVFEFTVAAPGTRTIEVSSVAKAVLDDHHQITGWRGVGRDITHQRKLEREIRYQATHDSLTGLINRREFKHLVQRVVAGGQQACDSYVAFIDLDRFKLINDSAGHHAGDAVLKHLADLLRTHVPGEETVARLGGDEFAACFEARNVPGAVETMERVIRELSDFRFDPGSPSLRLGASVGLVQVSPIYESAAQVMSDADASCYQAKNRGGNRVSVFQPELWESTSPRVVSPKERTHHRR